MAQITPCHFPKFGSAFHGPKRPVAIRTRATADQNPQLLSAWNQGRLSFLLQATWALVLRCYTTSEDICFGFQTVETDRSLQSTGIADVSTIRFCIDESDAVKTVIDKAKDDNSPNSYRDLNVTPDGYALFNTILMLRSYCDSATGHSQPGTANPLPDKASYDKSTLNMTV